MGNTNIDHEKTFSVKSKNTLEYVSFHDCIIEQAVWLGTTLILHFGWLDIFAIHPDNDTGKAKQTGRALVYFEGVSVKKSIYYDYAIAFEEGKKTGKQHYTLEDADVIEININEVLNSLEILSDEVISRQDSKIWKVEGAGFRIPKNFRSVEFEIEYHDAYVCFDNYIGDAWFESFGDKK